MNKLNGMYGHIDKPIIKVPKEKKVTIQRSAKIQKLIIEGQEIWFPSIEYVHELENELQQIKIAHESLVERLRRIEVRRNNERGSRQF